MLATLQILVVTTLVASLLYWALPARWVEGRRAILLLVSAVLIYTYNPVTLALAVFTALLALVLYHVTRRNPRLYWLPWLIVIPLVIDAIFPLQEWLPIPVGSPQSPILTTLATLGLSFYTFKLYMSIKVGLKRDSMPFREVLTTTLFYPSFPVGPIDGSQKFDREALSRDPDPRRWVMGIARIGMGAVKAFVIGAWIQTTASEYLLGANLTAVPGRGWDGPVEALLFAFLSFLFLYVNFSGFTDIAIGSGWMFNLDLTENFRFPLISRSIQNFWQRWHLSLAYFITTYMFKPMLRRTGKTSLSLIVTFTLIGLWHEVSIGYLFWGFAHGSALALTSWYRGLGKKPLPLPKPVKYVGGVVITLTFVSLVSTIANLPSNQSIITYLESFIGL